ncbi:hypothetical protein LZ31DRAFT_335999 [Colletotrichum somersetense]|nr:hypothetical protein LZ31DRAFT_335999 [Colletotrichum somersetense]
MADLYGSSNVDNNNNSNNLGRPLRPDRPPTAAAVTAATTSSDTNTSRNADQAVTTTSATTVTASASAAAAGASSSVSPKPAKRSSATTCVTCRARKVRCDGRRDICSNCERLGFSCTYEDSSSDASGLAAAPTFPLPRRRVRQACQSCHSRKARCSGHTPACDRCRAQGIDCVYRASKRTRLSINPPGRGDRGEQITRSPTSSTSAAATHRDQLNRRSLSQEEAVHDSDAAAGPDVVTSNTPSTFNHDLSAPDPQFESLISRALDNFFRHVHHIPMLSFLHRASLMQRHHVGGLDRPLLLALIGITSVLTDLGPGTRDYGEKCIDESESLILRSLENASTIKVQTLALIIKYRILTRRFSSAFMLAATAARFATALRLNYENPDLCFLAQESRRRLMWALFMIDQGMAGGYRDLTLWTPETIHISLPCNERDFEFDLAPPSLRPLVPSPDESENDDIGSLALHVRILWLRGRILKFAKRASSCSHEDLGRLQEQLEAFAKELADFAERLPVSFRWSDNSLRLRAYSPRLCVFIMIHVWWRQCNCDLFRIGLVGLRDSLSRPASERLGPGFVARCQRQCFEHAMEMSNMFASIKQLDHYPVADLDMPVCAYQCIRMLYYIYHLNAEEYGLTPDILRKKASVCLDVTKGCCSGTAAVSIQADLQRLMDHGLSIQATPNRLLSEEPCDERNGNGAKRVRVSRAKQVQLVEDPDNGAPAADELTNRPFGIGAWEDIQVPETENPVEQAPVPSQLTSIGSLEVNNAFEGALDSLDFNMEPMGLDSLAWFSNEWAHGDFQGEF